ncbi:MAG: HDOD domain-containing protein, partial [Chromatiales bacterium]
MTPQQLVDGIEKLVSLPEIFVKVNRLIDAPNYTAATLGDLIAQDTDLSARLLRLVNSAFYNLRAPVETISRAITMVGTHELRNLVMATSSARAFTGIPCDLVDMAVFWRYSLTTGVIATELANRCRVLHAERLFVMGLLHDIGRLVIYLKLPEISRDILLVTGGDNLLLPAVEEEMLGFTHMEVGEALLRQWNMPLSVITVVGNHHHPMRTKDFRLETSIMHLASILSLSEMDGIPVDEAMDQIEPPVWELTSLQPEMIEQTLEDIPQKVKEIIDVVLSPRISTKRSQP